MPNDAKARAHPFASATTCGRPLISAPNAGASLCRPGRQVLIKDLGHRHSRRLALEDPPDGPISCVRKKYRGLIHYRDWHSRVVEPTAEGSVALRVLSRLKLTTQALSIRPCQPADIGLLHAFRGVSNPWQTHLLAERFEVVDHRAELPTAKRSEWSSDGAVDRPERAYTWP